MTPVGTVIVRFDAIGDTVLTLPMIQTVIDRYSDAPVWLVGSSYAEALFRRVPGLTGVLSVDHPLVRALFHNAGQWDNQLIERIGMPERAFVVVANPDDIVASLQRIGVPEVIAASPAPPDGVHVADHLNQIAGGTAPAFPVLPLMPQDVDEVRARWPSLDRAAIVLPGAGGAKKRWVGFEELVARLKDDTKVVVVGGPADESALGPFWKVVEVLDEIPLSRLPAALSLARVVVANDSGPGHIAAAVGTPVVSIFTVMDPRTWAPRGTQVEVVVQPDVEVVIRAVRSVL